MTHTNTVSTFSRYFRTWVDLSILLLYTNHGLALLILVRSSCAYWNLGQEHTASVAAAVNSLLSENPEFLFALDFTCGHTRTYISAARRGFLKWSKYWLLFFITSSVSIVSLHIRMWETNLWCKGKLGFHNFWFKLGRTPCSEIWFRTPPFLKIEI